MARRVNTKFLAILTIVVVGGGILLLVAQRFLVHESPEKYISAGNNAMTDGKYDEAVRMFQLAVGLNQRDPALWVAYGDAMNKLSSNDLEFAIRARKAWDQALIIDPTNKPALDRMMQFWSDVSNFAGNDPNVFTQLESTAKKLFAADPHDSPSEIAIQTSVIRPWLAGVEKPEDLIRKTIENLKALMVKYPDNPDLPLFAAEGKLRLADRDRQRDQRDEADKLIKEVDQIIGDAVKRAPTAAMYFSAAQVAQAQESLANNMPASAAATQPVMTVAEWRKRRQSLYAKARELAKPEDPLFVFINLAAARASADDPAAAEKILRELMDKQPDDQQVRLALAEQLASDPARRKEAIAILDKPFASLKFSGPRAALIREFQIRTLVAATNLRLEQYAGAQSKDRDAMLPKIREGLALIESKDGAESARSLRLRGKLLKLQGEIIQAIQTLEKARALAEKNSQALESQGDRLDRWEITDLLARAYIETQQTGRAKQLLTEIINRFPGYEAGRMLLAQVLVKEGSMEEARPHIAYLKEHHPNDPEVIKLELQATDPRGTALVDKKDSGTQRDQLRAIYGKLPEETKGQMLDKVTAAMAIDNPDDALRLLNKLQSQMPGDFDVAKMGVRVFRYTGELDKARDFVDVAVKANPKDDKLLVLHKQVQDLTPEALQKIYEDQLAQNPDPLAKALGMAGLARQRKQPEQELKYLQEAQRLRPNDTNITALIFKCYIRMQQFDKAEMMLEPLAAANQDQAGGLLFRYQLDMVRGDYPKALDHARQLTTKMGEFGQSWLALAQALQANNMIEDAIQKYATALEKQSDSVEALRGMIQCCYGVGRPADARRYIDRARRASPSSAEFKEMEIQHELTYGDPEKAIPPREEAAQKSPDKPGIMLQLGQAYLAAARSRAAKSADATKPPAEMYSKARTTFRQGISKWPDEIAFYAYYAEAGARSGDLGDSELMLKQLAAREGWKDKVEPQSLLAEFYAVAHRNTDAEGAFRAILAKQPANTDVQIRLVNLLTSQNKVDDALKVLEANSQDPKVARRRVEILMSANRGDEADKVISDALDKSPSNLDLLCLGASVDIDHAKYDRAEKRLGRALEINAGDPTTHYYRGLLRMRQSKPDLDAAVAELAKGKDSPTMGTEARFALADCLRRKGDPDGALRELETALASQPGNMRVRLGLIDAYLAAQPPRWVDADRVIGDAKSLPGYMPNPDLLMREVNMLTTRNETSKALAAMQKAHELSPQDLDIARKYISLLLQQAKYPQVNQEVDALVARDKNLWWAYEMRAESRRKQGNKEDAIKDFEAALTAADAIRSDSAADQIVDRMGDVIGAEEVIVRLRSKAELQTRVKLMIARLQATKPDFDSAVKTLEEVMAQKEQLLPADKTSTLRFGAMLYLAVGQTDKSANCYDELLKLSPDDVISLNNMACLLAENVQPPRPQDGLPFAEHAYKLMQSSGLKDPVIMDTYAWLLILNQRVDEGIELLRAVNEIRPFPDPHYHLGEAYLKKGFGDQAQDELTRAMDLVRRAEQDKTASAVQLEPLKRKIEGAAGRAAVMSGKKPTAIAPTGTNVP